jgi:hypothetical protein
MICAINCRATVNRWLSILRVIMKAAQRELLPIHHAWWSSPGVVSSHADRIAASIADLGERAAASAQPL